VSYTGPALQVLSSDTVPFAIWCAVHHLDDFEEAMWVTVSGLGDRDTTCAIVGGIVGAARPIPSAWLASREPLRVT
jgi:ADP-ribosylglycohydrolase